MEWQPIETAPKDGTAFQAWCHDGLGERTVNQCWEPYARFNSDGNFEIWSRVDYDQDGWTHNINLDWLPTHWMPLPEPPAH